MHAQRSRDAEGPTVDEIAGVVLSILLERHPTLVSLDELFAEITVSVSSTRSTPEPLIHDGLGELLRAGLVHRIDDFFFASHAAVRASQL
jgi:hypothetical protein